MRKRPRKRYGLLTSEAINLFADGIQLDLDACLWYYNTTRQENRSMPFDSIIWDLDNDPDGNVEHCAEHGVTKEAVEEVFQNATDADISRSSGRPVVFGDTSTGRHLMVVYEEIDADTVYPVTAYDVPRRQQP